MRCIIVFTFQEKSTHDRSVTLDETMSATGSGSAKTVEPIPLEVLLQSRTGISLVHISAVNNLDPVLLKKVDDLQVPDTRKLSTDWSVNTILLHTNHLFSLWTSS